MPSPRPMPHLTLSEVALFWSRVESPSPSGCWEWSHRRSEGYGIFTIARKGKGLNLRANRVAFFLENGRITEDMVVCHSCDNPPCCNPSHLFAGTHLENMADCYRKGRLAIAWNKPRGLQNANSKVTPEQVVKARKRYAEGGIGQRELAREFGLSQSSMGAILRVETWKEIGMEIEVKQA